MIIVPIKVMVLIDGVKFFNIIFIFFKNNNYETFYFDDAGCCQHVCNA